MKANLLQYPRGKAPASMQAAAERFEEQFGTRFSTLHSFPKDLLLELHRSSGDPGPVPGDVVIASRSDPTVLGDIEALGRVANSSSIRQEDRVEYLEALKKIYSKLPRRPDQECRDPGTLCIGVHREGSKLAHAMHWLPEGRSFCPNAKRIPFEGGLIVGLTDFPVFPPYERCVIVDGAIASGATTMSIMEELRGTTSEFHVYSVHGPYEGLRAIMRFGELRDLKVVLTVGHATQGINDHFYAVDPRDPRRVVVGDLGDTISDLPDEE